MKIRKTQQPSSFAENQIHDAYSSSTSDTYSCNYINEIEAKFYYVIEKSSNWIIKQYENGLVEMFHSVGGNFSITQQYAGKGNYGTMWCQTPEYPFPITLKKLYSANTTITSAGHLTGFNYSYLGLDKYQGYLYDAMELPSQYVRLCTRIVGTWK